MAGEINGTKVIVQDATGEIVGQLDGTVTYNGNMLDVSNKSFGDSVTYAAGERASKQVTFAGTFVYNSDAQFRAMRAAYHGSTIDAYTITFTSDATTDEAITGNFAVTAMSDTLPMGDKVTTSITLSSSGDYTVTQAAS